MLLLNGLCWNFVGISVLYLCGSIVNTILHTYSYWTYLVCLLLEAASVNRSTHVRFDSDEDESDQQSPEAQVCELSPRAWYPLGTDQASAHTSAPTASFGAPIHTTQHRGAVQPCVTQQQGAVEDGRAPTLLPPGQQQQQENSRPQTAVGHSQYLYFT